MTHSQPISQTHENLTALELSELAATNSNMWPMIRNHPNCYPDLAEWIDAQQPRNNHPIPGAAPSPALDLYRGGLMATQFIMLIVLTQPVVAANSLLGSIGLSYFAPELHSSGIFLALAYLGIGAAALCLVFIRRRTFQEITGGIAALVSLFITGFHCLLLMGFVLAAVDQPSVSITPTVPILVILGLVSTGLAFATVLTAKKITTN